MPPSTQPPPAVTIRAVRWDAPEAAALLALRLEVFCVEQGVPETLERDEHDARAVHLGAWLDQTLVGTLRIVLREGSREAKIGRVAVRRSHRRRGIGRLLMLAAIDHCRSRGVATAVLASQDAAIPFYEALGFTVEGAPFTEAGIPHRWMRLPLQP